MDASLTRISFEPKRRGAGDGEGARRRPHARGGLLRRRHGAASRQVLHAGPVPPVQEPAVRQGLSRPLLAFDGSLPTLPIAIRNPESQSAPRLLFNLLAVAGNLRLTGGQRVDG